MLWYKSWLDSRWRFLIGLAILLFSAGSAVFLYPQVASMVSMAAAVADSGRIGREIQAAAELQRDYRGYIWAQWFRQNLPQLGTFFAVVLGTGSMLSQVSRGAMFTLSLPVSRRQLLAARAGIGLLELALLALVPSLLIPILSPAVGESYSLLDTLVYAACMFVGSATFFSLAFLLSTYFADYWRPALIALCAALVIGGIQRSFGDRLPPIFSHVMSGELYFRGRGVPWLAVLLSVLVSALLLLGAERRCAKQDF